MRNITIYKYKEQVTIYSDILLNHDALTIIEKLLAVAASNIISYY